MFRTAVRRFATTAVRSVEAGAPSAHLVEIAKAQRIAHNGFIDGTPLAFALYMIRQA